MNMQLMVNANRVESFIRLLPTPSIRTKTGFSIFSLAGYVFLNETTSDAELLKTKHVLLKLIVESGIIRFTLDI